MPNNPRRALQVYMSRLRSVLAAEARLTTAEPARETFAAATMLALYRSGRQADALAAYAELVSRDPRRP
ncbi:MULTISPECIES: BTAD domain-containing putative transcriptional regulator [unclassified Kribbella]|uniref:BTAD domain-containing putative transcriptional regulator n=1 Tax=unclassified Kribbella TaxID=2644121 RepID=UPI0033C257CE